MTCLFYFNKMLYYFILTTHKYLVLVWFMYTGVGKSKHAACGSMSIFKRDEWFLYGSIQLCPNNT